MHRIDVTAAVKGTCTFDFYRNGILYYRTESGDIFPVPASDLGGASVNATEKGMFLMRYMRKFNEEIAAQSVG